MSYGDGFKRRKVADEALAFKPSTRYRPAGGRDWTVSVAIPTSILSDCTTSEQRINAPSRIARALAIFSVDEVVVFDDSPADTRPPAVDHDAYTGDTDPGHYLEHLLSYMETPPFMRRALFPLHPNLRLQGLLPLLEMPHHPHPDEHLPYMEGLTTADKPDAPGMKTLVDVGLRRPVAIREAIPPKTRVTLHLPRAQALFDGAAVAGAGAGAGSNKSTITAAASAFADATPVDPAAPRTDPTTGGFYWGFQIRRCGSLSAVFSEAPHADGYDVSIGTSERGRAASLVFPRRDTADATMEFRHLVVVLGGPRGLEYAAMNDPALQALGIGTANVRELFDHWVNVLPGQGVRSMRTDEAVFVALTELRRLWSEI